MSTRDIREVYVTPCGYNPREMKFSTLLEKSYGIAGKYFRLEGYGFERKEFNNLSLINITFTKCVFRNCDFRHTTMNRCEFIDCIFDQCQIFSDNIHQTSFMDCVFINNRIEHSMINDVVISCSKNFIDNHKIDEAEIVSNKTNQVSNCYINKLVIRGMSDGLEINNLTVVFSTIIRSHITPFICNDCGLFNVIIIDSIIKIVKTIGTCDMEHVDLSDTSIINITGEDEYINLYRTTMNRQYVPSEGSFIAWMVEFTDLEDAKYTTFLIKVEVPEDAIRYSTTENQCTVCKCNKAKVLSIKNLDTGEETSEVELWVFPFKDPNNKNRKYKVGELVEEDIKERLPKVNNELGKKGLTIFLSKETALDYARVEI